MNKVDKKLQRLIGMAGPPAGPVRASMSPWFARRVVQRWLATPASHAQDTSWNRVSCRGLALAGTAMCLSLVLHGLSWLHPDSPEQLASEAVVQFLLPR